MVLEDRVLAGRYRLIAQVGAGGMARVYRGVDGVLDRTVAVKVLADPFAADPAFVSRFEREARSAAGLSHPGVVSVFDTGSDDGIHFIVMEYVEGETLAAMLHREGPLEPGRAAEIAVAVCDALAVAHDDGLVHRDIKPGNVMVTPVGAVKVMDFGIARAVTAETLTGTGTVLGTAAYLSPEQAQGGPSDRRSDLYSLGCMVYEMLTGRPPFGGDLPVAVAARHVTDTPEPPSGVRPGVPAEMDAVVMRALAKDPDRRYQDARAMAQDLSRAARTFAGVGVAPDTQAFVATDVGGTEVLPRDRTPVLPRASAARPPGPPGRRRWFTALAAAAGLALVALLIFVALSNRGAGQEGSTPPSPKTPPASTSPTPPTVAQALAHLTAVVTAGEQAGNVDHGTGDDLLHRAQDLVRSSEDGHGEDTQHKFDDLEKKVDDDIKKGKITSSSRAQILAAVRELGRALRVGSGG